MGLLFSLKLFKRFPSTQVLTKSHETLLYQLFSFPLFPHLPLLYSPQPQQTPCTHCDSSTEVGAYVFIVVSSWKVLPLESYRAHSIISSNSLLNSQLLQGPSSPPPTFWHLLSLSPPSFPPQLYFSHITYYIFIYLSYSFLTPPFWI